MLDEDKDGEGEEGEGDEEGEDEEGEGEGEGLEVRRCGSPFIHPRGCPAAPKTP